MKERQRVLLVQCCSIPEWAFLVQKLRREHPDWQIETLVLEHPQVRSYIDILGIEAPLHFLGSEESLAPAYDLILLPEVNRGYLSMRLRASGLSGEKRSVNLEGKIGKRQGLLRSFLAGLRRGSEKSSEYEEFLDDFPHRPLGPEVLLLHSTRRQSLGEIEEKLRDILPHPCHVTLHRDSRFWRSWKKLRTSSFDSCVVILDGDRGFLKLKLLAFLGGFPEVLCLNENGDRFYANSRSLARFLFTRLTRGLSYEKKPDRILLYQTESAQYTRAALRRIRKIPGFSEAELRLVCRRQDSDSFRDLLAPQQLIPYPRKAGFSTVWGLRRLLHDFDPDVNIGIFSGRPVFRRQKWLLLLLGARRIFALNAQLEGYWLTLRTLPRIFHRDEPLFEIDRADVSARRVLLIQTEGLPYIEGALEKIRSPKLYPDAEVHLVCREEDREHFQGRDDVDQIHAYRKKFSPWKRLQFWNRLRRLQPEVKFAVFSGRPVFRPAKLLYFSLPARSRFAFNAQLEGYWLSWKTLSRIFRKDQLLYDLDRGDKTAESVLLVQTEAPEYAEAALEAIRDPKLYPDAEVHLLCREEDASRFADDPRVHQIYVNQGGWSLGRFFRLWRQLRRLDADVNCAIFTGRPVFRPWKLIFLLQSGPKLILDASLEGYWLSPGTLRRLFHREPLLFDLEEPVANVLLIESDEADSMAKAAATIRQPHVVPHASIKLFCSEERRSILEERIRPQETVTYRGHVLSDLRTLASFFVTRPPVVAAIFPRRRNFMRHKALFWILPAGSRLAFNESLDCFYVNRKNALDLVRKAGRRPALSLFEPIVAGLLKIVLFLPRFAYLLLWLALQNARSKKRRTG